MKLGLRIKVGTVIVYREKWGTLAVALAVVLGCMLIAVLAFRAGRTPTGFPRVFLLSFAAVFALVGAIALFRFPGQARQVVRDDGVLLLEADEAGIQLTPNFGAPTQHRLWSSVSEIVLAEKMRAIDSGETSYAWRKVIVFLVPDQARADTWLERVKSGTATSGEARAYLLGGFPRGKARDIQLALQCLAPSSVRIRCCQQATFDHKAGQDIYLDI